MALSYKNDEQQDERLNPGSDEARRLRERENDIPGYDRKNDGLDDHPISAGDASGVSGDLAGGKNNDNIDATKKREEESSGWKNNFSGGDKQKVDIKGAFKKKGPMALIISLLLGGGGGLTFLFSPGIAIVQLKEILMGDLNDQLGAMQVFDDHLLKGKLKSLQGGIGFCSNAVSIRCKFSTMSKREVTAFKNAGIEMEPNEPNKIFGRTKPTKFTFPDGTVTTNPQELENYINRNPAGRSILKRATNPKFFALYDKVAAGVFTRFKANRAPKVVGASEEERNKAVDASLSGEDISISAEGFKTDEEGRQYVEDTDGTRVYKDAPSSGSLPAGSRVDAAKFNEVSALNKSKLGNIESKVAGAKLGSKAVGSVLSSGLKGLSVIGAADTACTINNTARAIAAAAKATRAVQLFLYAMVFFNVADRIKAGTATPEEVEYVGNRLTATDTRQQIVDELSIWQGGGPNSAEAKPHDNPYYGANALDSAGYKVAAYNEAPLLTSRDLQYTIGGGLVGTLSSVLDSVAKVLGGKKNIRSVCKVVQSWWARGAGLIAGIASAIGSFGVTAAVTLGAGVALGFAMPFLEAALADIIAGKTATSATAGVDSGDATFSGAGALFGGMAMGHGMTPADKGNLKQYLALNNKIKQEDIAVQIYEAKDTPFDINKQYSFLGSLVRKVNPSLLKTTASVSGALTSIPSLLGVAAKSIVPDAGAAEQFNDERFSKCANDEGYAELGIDADVFCGARYYMSTEQLATTPDASAKWMQDNGHIEEDGTPKSETYKDWITYCTQRQDGWGETSNDDDNSDQAIGLSCVPKDKNPQELEQLKYFGAYYMPFQIQDTKDNGIVTGTATSTGSQAGAATPEICKTMAADDLGQIACKAYQFDEYGYLWAGGHGGTAAGFMSAFRAGEYKPGKDAILDCSGLVRMSIFDATGVDIGGLSTGDYPRYAKFKEISKEEAKAGDILYTAVHTEIVVSNDTAAKKFQTFGAHTADTAFDKQIGPSTSSYDGYTKVFRFAK